MTTLLSAFQPIGGIDNLVDPSLNPVPGTPELSIAPPNYAPGTTDTPVSGPNPRTISNVVSGGQSADGDNAQTNDPTGASAWLYAFGQFVDHDLDLEAVGTDPSVSIPVPDGDPNFPNGTTIPLDRATTSPTTGTAINTIAGSLDLSQIYGSDATTAASLRGANGTLLTTAGGNLPIVDGAFVSGDARVDENPELTAISKLFVDEHNYWAGVLAQENPTWTSDQIYNQARAITTAEYQNIIYTEYLPALLGPAAPAYTGFNPSINTEVTQEFSTAAFRLGHSQVSDNQQGIDNNGNVLFQQTLADSFGNTPTQDEANGGLDALVRDLSNDNSQAVDVYAVDGLRNLLAASPDQMDLIAIDIERERDLGLGTLNQTREALGLTPYTSFSQLTSDPTVAANLQTEYGSIDNVDLFIGGLAENHAPGADVGQTFQTIISQQFSNLENGDQFFWQNENFDPQTAQMISQTTLADIIERNTGTPAEQSNVFMAEQRVSSGVPPADPTMPQLIVEPDMSGTVIAGGPADDTLVAGNAIHQVLTGGGGSDTFQFNGNGHTGDIITDWNSSDVMQYQAGSDDSSTAAPMTGNVTISLHDMNGGTMVRFESNSVYLQGVQASSLTASNFLVPPGATMSLSVDQGGRNPGAIASASSGFSSHW